MAPKGRSSLSAFLADLSNPNAAGDFDPEAGALGNGLLRGSAFSMVDADGNAASGSDDSGSEASEDEATAIRRGYVQVGQGAVKKGLELDLGDKYAGKKASRAALLGEEGSDNDDENDDEDMDGEGFEDEAQGSEEDGPEDTVDEGSDDNGAEVEMSEDDDEDDEGMDLRSLARQLSANGKASKSSKAAAPAESDSEGSGEESEVSEEESEQSAASEDEQTATTTKKRSRLKDVNAELRELEKEEEELLKSLSANARADVEKGRHVRAQIVSFIDCSVFCSIDLLRGQCTANLRIPAGPPDQAPTLAPARQPTPSARFSSLFPPFDIR